MLQRIVLIGAVGRVHLEVVRLCTVCCEIELCVCVCVCVYTMYVCMCVCVYEWCVYRCVVCVYERVYTMYRCVCVREEDKSIEQEKEEKELYYTHTCE